MPREHFFDTVYCEVQNVGWRRRGAIGKIALAWFSFFLRGIKGGGLEWKTTGWEGGEEGMAGREWQRDRNVGLSQTSSVRPFAPSIGSAMESDSESAFRWVGRAISRTPALPFSSREFYKCLYLASAHFLSIPSSSAQSRGLPILFPPTLIPSCGIYSQSR